jgi:hypothetical protein
MGTYPDGWEKVFDLLQEGDSLRQRVANFGVKFRLTNDLSTNAFAGDSDSSDAYYVMLKASLLYSAVEAWEKIAGKPGLASANSTLANEIRAIPRWPQFRTALLVAVDSKKLLSKLEDFSSGSNDDLMPVLAAVRHGFFHPQLTAQNSSLSLSGDLRSSLLRMIEEVMQNLAAAFSSWANSTALWFEMHSEGDDDLMREASSMPVVAGHTRQRIQQEYAREFSDSQWAMLVEEVWQEDEYSYEEWISEVMENFESYVSEYASWQENLDEAAKRQNLQSDRFEDTN